MENQCLNMVLLHEEDGHLIEDKWKDKAEDTRLSELHKSHATGEFVIVHKIVAIHYLVWLRAS